MSQNMGETWGVNRCLHPNEGDDTKHPGIGVGLQLHSDDSVGAQLPGLLLGLLDELGPLGAPRVRLCREVGMFIMIRRLPCKYQYYPMYQIVKKNI